MEALKQKGMKPNTQTGSFINMLMSNNSTVPEVGKGATVLMWTDRHAYEVIEVSDDKKRVVVQQYFPKRIDKNGMSESQEYEYKELSPVKEVIVWKWGGWKWEKEEVTFTKEFKEVHKECYSLSRCLTEEQREEIFQGEVLPQKVVSGITRKHKVYSNVNIVWGEKREYYDFTF